MVQTLPSHKLLDLSYQVASRLGAVEEQAAFQELLHHLLTRLATQHPHHVLLHLFSIRAQSQTDKSKAADNILQVRTTHAVELKNHEMPQMCVCSAYSPAVTLLLLGAEKQMLFMHLNPVSICIYHVAGSIYACIQAKTPRHRGNYLNNFAESYDALMLSHSQMLFA
jgi:hypothetical protein